MHTRFRKANRDPFNVAAVPSDDTDLLPVL